MLHHALRAATGNEAVVPSVTFNGSYTQATGGSTTITFTGVSFGTAATGRIVAVGVAGSSSTNIVINSVTIGGVSATLAIQTTSSARHSGIYYAQLDTGSSGSVVVTVSGTPGTNEFLEVFSLYDVTTFTATDAQRDQSTATGVTSSRSVTLSSLQSNSVAIGHWSAGAVASGGATTWTNLTEQSDVYEGTSAYSAAMAANIGSGNLTVSCTNSDTSVNRPALLAAAWR